MSDQTAENARLKERLGYLKAVGIWLSPMHPKMFEELDAERRDIEALLPPEDHVGDEWWR